MNLKKIEELYTNNLKQFGIDSKSVGWKDSDSQELRFQKLCAVMDSPLPFSVNELGCGYGELVPFLDQNFPKLLHTYNGYDISKDMLDAAVKYIGEDPRAHWFHESRLQTEADYCITSGIFNVRFDENESSWKEYIFDTLIAMYKHANKGISFNLLSTYVDWKADNLHYQDPTELFDFCKKNLSKKVALLHDYPLFEFTILVRK